MDISIYQKMFDRATFNQKPDQSKTLAAWHQRAVLTREALLEARRQYQADVKELKDTYAPRVFEEKRKASDESYNGLVSVAMNKAKADLDTVLEGKKARFDECCGAPTDADLRLLNVLSMRDSLTPDEVANVSAKFGGNLQALRLLRDISKRHNIFFPDIGDPAEFETRIERARQFGTEMIDSLATPDSELSYRQRLFWCAPGDGEAATFFGPLDGQGFTAVQIENYTADERRENDVKAEKIDTKSGEYWAEIRCRGGESLLSISEQFHTDTQAIRAANPGKDLTHLYAGDRLLVPSTRFAFRPGGISVQPEQVRPVPAPHFEAPRGPHGEEVGEDIALVP